MDEEVAFCVKKWIDCENLHFRNGHEQAESFWVKIRSWTSGDWGLLQVA